MIERISIVLFILAVYLAVRKLACDFFSKEIEDGEVSNFLFVWSFFMAIPLTALAIGLPSIILAFIFGWLS